MHTENICTQQKNSFTGLMLAVTTLTRFLGRVKLLNSWLRE